MAKAAAAGERGIGRNEAFVPWGPRMGRLARILSVFCLRGLFSFLFGHIVVCTFLVCLPSVGDLEIFFGAAVWIGEIHVELQVFFGSNPTVNRT